MRNLLLSLNEIQSQTEVIFTWHLSNRIEGILKTFIEIQVY